MSKDWFIPQKIKVGYQQRNDTYTGQLAYVIYYDNKGKLHKETSWENWRNKAIDPQVFDNAPTEGFVLNKKVGGYKSGWDFRQAYVRVYDPRGFEFEITVPNLLYILENTSSIKGKGLEGEFVYAWSGADLVLLPTTSPDYAELVKLNAKRFSDKKISAKDLKIGSTYQSNDNTELVYMGRFDYYERGYRCGDKWFASHRKAYDYAHEHGIGHYVDRYLGRSFYYDVKWGETGTAGKKHCFYSRATDDFVWLSSIPNTIVDLVLETPANDYAELFELLETKASYSPYDPTKDCKYYLSIEEIKEILDKNYYGFTFQAEGIGQIRIQGPGENGLYRLQIAGKYDTRPYFPVRETGYPYNPYEMIPVPLSEIHNTMMLYSTKKYLANGKFYRMDYT